jgi:lactate dehydrogenase-like 2-hydroxyacid dehydrogenase
MTARRIFVTWLMEPEARALLERVGTVETSLTEHALTPHIGSASRATRLKMATRAAENCVAALEGRRPPNLVNPEAWRSA